MNGKDMLEAMSFVDERYVQDAQEVPRRRRAILWLGPALAACLALAVGLGTFGQKQNEEIALAVQGNAVYGSDGDSADMIMDGVAASGPMEMTVRVVEQSGQTLRCVVEDPGTGTFTSGQEITVVLESDGSTLSRASGSEAVPYAEGDMEVAEDTEAETEAAASRLWILYTTTEDDTTVTAITWSATAEETTEN